MFCETRCIDGVYKMLTDKLIQRFWQGLIGLMASYSIPAFSQGGLGDVAGNATGATDLMTSVLSDIFYVIGIAFVVASVVQFREHRDNPSQTPLIRPILLLIIGLVIGTFPLLVKWTTGKVPTLG